METAYTPPSRSVHAPRMDWSAPSARNAEGSRGAISSSVVDAIGQSSRGRGKQRAGASTSTVVMFPIPADSKVEDLAQAVQQANSRSEGDALTLLRDAVALKYGPSEGELHETLKATVWTSYTQFNKFTDEQTVIGADKAGGMKVDHRKRWDLINLSPSAAALVIRMAGGSRKIAAGVQIGGQAITGLMSPYGTTKGLVNILPEQAAHRVGTSVDFGGAANLPKAIWAGIKEAWNANKSSDAENLQMRKDQLDRATEKHYSKVRTGRNENYANMVRSAINLAAAEVAMSINHRWPSIGPRLPVNFVGQYIAVRALWYVSRTRFGPAQDLLLQREGMQSSINHRIPKIAADLYTRQTGRDFPKGTDRISARARTDAMDNLVLDDQARAEMEKLFKHQIKLRVDNVVKSIEKEKTPLLNELSALTGLPAAALDARLELARQGVVPARQVREIAPDEDDMHDPSEVLLMLNTEHDAAFAKLDFEQTNQADVLEQRIDHINHEIAHIESGDNHRWSQLAPDRIVKLVRSLAPTDDQIHADAVAEGTRKWNTQFFKEVVPHMIQKYANPWQLLGAGSNGGLQIMLGAFNWLAASGMPVKYLTRALAVVGQFGVFLVTQLASGLILAEKVNTRAWTRSFDNAPMRPVQFAIILGLSFWGTLVLARTAVYGLPMLGISQAALKYRLSRLGGDKKTDSSMEMGTGKLLSPTRSSFDGSRRGSTIPPLASGALSPVSDASGHNETDDARRRDA